MQQTNFFGSSRKEHGGSVSAGRQRSHRPMCTKNALHITHRSPFATGSRSLLKYEGLLRRIEKKAAKQFGISTYVFAICSNHVHLAIRGKKLKDIQNYFRVFSGHTAQAILRSNPIGRAEREAHEAKTGAPKGCKKNQRVFWENLIYSRILTWGREFQAVVNYIHLNQLEALNLIAYKPRKKQRKPPS